MTNSQHYLLLCLRRYLLRDIRFALFACGLITSRYLPLPAAGKFGDINSDYIPIEQLNVYSFTC
jgi:hypothetical protein